MRGQKFTNWIDFFAILKRNYYGIYCSYSSKHLQRYVDECIEKANAKNIELNNRTMLTFAKGMDKHLSYN